MNELEQRLELFGNLLKCAKLNLWKFDKELNMISSTYDNPEFYLGLFHIGGIGEQAIERFTDSLSNIPILISDSFGLAWIVAPLYTDKTLLSLHAIGPAFFNNISEYAPDQRLRDSSMPIPWKKAFKEQISSFPVISINLFSIYAHMLSYCITETYLSALDKLTLPSKFQSPPTVQESAAYHSDYASELLLTRAIESGNLEALSKIQFASRMGALSLDDPLRAVKNQGIVLATIATRAAIAGGFPEKSAFLLSDRTILALEASSDINTSLQIMGDYLTDITTRVHQLHLKDMSPVILACYEYIEAHVEESINYTSMAKALGYSRNYLASYFKKETGSTLSHAVNIGKIEHAKILLTHSDITIQEISERLCYSSPSYFTSIFRQITGMTPSEYQHQ